MNVSNYVYLRVLVTHQGIKFLRKIRDWICNRAYACCFDTVVT